MDGEKITTRDMLRQMEAKDGNGDPVPFSFTYVTHNRNSKRGGKLKGYDNATLATSSGKKKKNYTGTHTAYQRENKHRVNMTRHIFIGDHPHPQKFNIRLIVRFNGLKVVY